MTKLKTTIFLWLLLMLLIAGMLGCSDSQDDVSSLNKPVERSAPVPPLVGADGSVDVSAYVPIQERAISAKWEKRVYFEELRGPEQTVSFAVMQFSSEMDWDGDGKRDMITIRYDDESRLLWEAHMQRQWQALWSSQYDPETKQTGQVADTPQAPSKQPCDHVCLVSFSVNGDQSERMTLNSIALDTTMERSFFLRVKEDEKQLTFALRSDGPSMDPAYHFFSRPMGKPHLLETINFRDELYVDGRGNLISSWQVTHTAPRLAFGAFHAKTFTYRPFSKAHKPYTTKCGESSFTAYFKEAERSAPRPAYVDYFTEDFVLGKPQTCQVIEVFFYEKEADMPDSSMLTDRVNEYYVELADGRSGYLAYFDAD